MYCKDCRYYINKRCTNPDSSYTGAVMDKRDWCGELEEKKMEIKIMVDEGGLIPTKAHEADAGFDLYAPERVCIKPGESALVNTGVHFQIPFGYVGMIKSKSGLNVKHGILCEGVIDSGYTGPVKAKLYNNSDGFVSFEKGQKITQIVFLPIPDVELVITKTFEETARGNNGFGSTGKFASGVFGEPMKIKGDEDK